MKRRSFLKNLVALLVVAPTTVVACKFGASRAVAEEDYGYIRAAQIVLNSQPSHEGVQAGDRVGYYARGFVADRRHILAQRKHNRQVSTILKRMA